MLPGVLVTTEPLNMGAPVASSYDGSTAIFRLLRDSSWGPALMNLGWFNLRGPFAFFNLTANLADRQRALAERSIGLMDLQAGQDVLDVACGRGMTSYMIRRAHPTVRVTGLDLLPENVQVARTLFANQPGLEYEVGDATSLPYPDATFDRIHCLEGAFHFPDRGRFLIEAGRVLRPNGRMAVVDFVWADARHRVQRETEAGKLMRRLWQWDDLSTADEYRVQAADAGLALTAHHDWTSRVATPNARLLEWLIRLKQSAWGSRLIESMNPLLRSVSPDDWRELQQMARAQREMEPSSRYVAMVFSKP